MGDVSSSLVNSASSADPGLVQGAASIMVLKKAMNVQASWALQLLSALPQQPALATSGTLGTQLNAYA